ncbi:MAG: DnaD domain protein [Clostridia bacterium]|nr:DnaD domain protein [Clostridia bacterium]
MEFSLNMKSISSSFPVPCEVADKYIKLASGEQIKVLLLAMRDLSDKIDVSGIAEKLKTDKTAVEDALLFWTQCGIVTRAETPPERKEKQVVITAEMPTRRDVIARGMEDEKIRLLLREAQLKFGRGLKNNESRLLVSLYDDYGMDVSVILLLLQHAASQKKTNLTYIRSTAEKWLKAGVETVLDGETLIADEAKGKLAFSVVRRAFGIDDRLPSEKETEYSDIWVNKWGMTPELIKAAYDVCIDSKAKISFPYINKILEKWHKAGYKTVKDVKEEKKTPSKKGGSSSDFAGFDLDAFEAKLNSD